MHVSPIPPATSSGQRYTITLLPALRSPFPAMVAGVITKLWSSTDMVRVIEDLETARSGKISGDMLIG
jgi:hypothetical protein